MGRGIFVEKIIWKNNARTPAQTAGAKNQNGSSRFEAFNDKGEH